MFKSGLLDPKNPRKVFTLLWWEATFAITYETWVHPNYLSGLAGEMKIPLSLVSILAAIPWIGASGQIFGAWAFERSDSVKSYVLRVAGLGRSLWILPLAAALYWGQRAYLTDTPFPSHLWFLIAAFCACCSSLLTSASSNAWMYWMKSLIPSELQGQFFGTRQRFTTLSFVGASLIAVSLVGWIPHGYRVGTGILCFGALVAGAISIYLHSLVQNVPILRSSNETRRSLRELIQKPLKDPAFREFLFFGANFNGTIQLAGSFFPYYFTKEMNIPMSTVALWTGLVNLGCFAAASYWGKRADRTDAPYEILWYTGHVVAFSPLIYFFIQDRTLIQMIAPLEYFTYGLAWSGFVLAQTKLLFRLSPAKEGASYFSVYAAICGITGGICTFLGGQIAQFFTPWGGFRLLWLLSFFARLSVLWIFCRPLLQLKTSNLEEIELQEVL